MKASNINIRALESSSQCYDTIDRIWDDSDNIQGGIKAFMSGKTTYLTATAKKKVEAIERRAIVLSTTQD